jgi:flagellar hook-length control protein FliK
MMANSNPLSGQRPGAQGIAALLGGAFPVAAGGEAQGGFDRLLAALPVAGLPANGASALPAALPTALAAAPVSAPAGEPQFEGSAPAIVDIEVDFDQGSDEVGGPAAPLPDGTPAPAIAPGAAATKAVENLLKAHAGKATKNATGIDADGTVAKGEKLAGDAVSPTDGEAIETPPVASAPDVDAEAAPDRTGVPVTIAATTNGATKADEAAPAKTKNVATNGTQLPAPAGARTPANGATADKARAANRQNATPVLPASAKAADHASPMSAVLAAASDRSRPAPQVNDAPSMAVLLHRPEAAPVPGAPNNVAAGPVADRILDMTSDDVWIEQLARDIVATKSDEGDISFRLMPRHLGRLDVAMRMEGDGVSLKLETQHEATATIVTAAQGRLVEDLRQQGVRVTGADVTCTHGDAGRQSQQGQGRAATADPAHLIETATDRAEARDDKRAADRRGRFA